MPQVLEQNLFLLRVKRCPQLLPFQYVLHHESWPLNIYSNICGASLLGINTYKRERGGLSNIISKAFPRKLSLLRT